jgi:putative flavoprotein involved in K+ transport
VRTHSPVTSLAGHDSGFVLRTPEEEFEARCVVLASGLLNVPRKSALAGRLPRRLLQLHSAEYRDSNQLAPGAVLVIGGAQSGAQIAEDLHRAGRRVYLSTSPVGRYDWTYRGRETFGWLVDAGFWGQRPADLEDPAIMRAAYPLVASGGRTLNLPLLAEMGVTLLGRIEAVVGEQLFLDDSLAANIEFGDRFWARTRGLIDDHIAGSGVDAPSPDAETETGQIDQSGMRILDLAGADIGSVVWCIGFTGDLSWVDLPVVDDTGSLRNNGCAAALPGLWLLGFPWLTRRQSGILYGFPFDAADTAEAITQHLAST